MEQLSEGPVRVIGYLRVSTADQADSGAGVEAQRQAIEQTASQRGWQLVTVLADEGMSAASMDNRPALAAALGLVEAGGADAICVAKLDRLSRSLIDFAGMLDRARRHGWALIALDLGVDTTTECGELVANVMMSVAQWERRRIGTRTREALAVKKAQGVRLGRPSKTSAKTLARIVREADAGASLGKIARDLNTDRVPTSQGGAKWYPSTVRAVLQRVGS